MDVITSQTKQEKQKHKTNRPKVQREREGKKESTPQEAMPAAGH